MAGVKGSTRGAIRWRPTSEQLMILEELFKGGIKSPTSNQVQKITTRLKEHGKVETKNVFYWFQNHKAREKQKLRRKLGQHQQMIQLQVTNNDFVYYNIHPQPHFACGFLPFYPPQAMTDLVSRKDEETTQEYASSSSWKITWLSTDLDRENRPLETLELFPTTANATKETATTVAISASSSNMSSSSEILLSL